MDGAIGEREVRATGMPTECALVRFLFGQLIDLIRSQRKVSSVADVAVDVIKRFEHHGPIVARDSGPYGKANGAGKVGRFTDHDRLAGAVGNILDANA